MRKITEALERSRKSHFNAIIKAENLLKKKVDFDFFISYQETEGFIMVYYDTDRDFPYNRLLDRALQVIEHKGILTIEDYKKLSI